MTGSIGEKTSLELIAAPAIEKRIFVVRERQVMLDEDLADLYGVETRVLVQQVKRNAKRFPADFMFQLDEAGGRSFEITNCDLKRRAGRTALRAVCLHRAGRGDALRRPSQRSGGRGEFTWDELTPRCADSLVLDAYPFGKCLEMPISGRHGGPTDR